MASTPACGRSTGPEPEVLQHEQTYGMHGQTVWPVVRPDFRQDKSAEVYQGGRHRVLVCGQLASVTVAGSPATKKIQRSTNRNS